MRAGPCKPFGHSELHIHSQLSLSSSPPSPETFRKMPGLMNWATLSRLPLIASEVTSCVSGYAFGMTALLTYHNPDPQALEGKF